MAIVLALLCLAATQAIAQAPGASGVSVSPHNLSVTGTGAVRAVAEDQVCIFCHTPHNASPVQPLWNRQLPVSAYTVYTSRSMDALPGQPTGSSKLCLSCHDGTIALGSVVSPNQPIAMAGGMTTLPPGRPSNLGTDLRDDHPISFRYDNTLATRDTKLKNPAQVPQQVRLDRNAEMQCISCHDPHNNLYGRFLVMSNQGSELCNACHQLGSTQVAGHAQCVSCHKQHTAPSGPYLLARTTTTQTCLSCHGGQPGSGTAKNIAPDLTKLANHDNDPPVNLPSPEPTTSTCSDCHNPHTMKTTTAVAPNVPGNFGQVSGVSAAGARVPTASYEYEVCFKCHADQQAVQPRITRQIVQANTRLEFAPSAVSFHPVEVPGKSTDVPSLKPGWTTASVMYCNDCHNSDTGQKAGGSGPDGVHGSNNRSLLIARYDTTDNTSESAAAYALCYRCHDRNRIITENGPFRYHKKHIQELRTPCSVCHDPHGISSAQGNTTNNSRLINFDRTAVTPNSANKLFFEDRGNRTGACYLRCHGNNHNPKSY